MSMVEESTPRERSMAVQLARALEPIVKRQIAAATLPPIVRVKIPLAADARLVRDARAVAEALTRLDGAKYTSDERPARLALERACRSLRETTRKHGYVEAPTSIGKSQ
ncbi:hypothetical protein [Mesorhizobium sp. B2-8-9]|uniref:hypothetical protein n=1 Tax=Mesorhizobium sp. B2-8-9 TaxID=2589899 RepID=UPI0011277B19|nr:hypothetical protein [Mesorhizobium sp. B2-8-9]TPI86384.1 hypothetical protein FJ423_00745 [Mesorhizobium sp. B2-8-9]